MYARKGLPLPCIPKRKIRKGVKFTMQANMKAKIFRFALVALCLIALLGYMMPMMSMEINVFDRAGQSVDISLRNLRTLGNDSDSPLGGVDSPDSVLSGFLGDDEDMPEVANNMRNTMVLYIVTLVLLVALLVLFAINKLKKTSIALLTVSLAFYIYIGNTVSGLAVDIISSLEQRLGFFAFLFNLSEMINVSLGIGYWLTIITIGCMLFVSVANLLLSKGNHTLNTNN